MKLYFINDGSLIIAKLHTDGTVRSTTLISPGHFEVVKLTGYLRNLSGKEAFDLLTTGDFSYPDNLSLDNLSLDSQNVRKSDLKQAGTTDKCIE